MKRTTLLLLSLISAGAAQDVAAQACLGSPAAPNQVAITGGVSLTDGATGYGGEVLSNPEGPFVVMVGASVTDLESIDDNMSTFGGAMGFELPVTSVSVCPSVGASYSSLSTTAFGYDVDVSIVGIPVEMNVGRSFMTNDGLELIPSGSAGLIHLRSKAEVSGFEEEEDTSNEFLGGAGLTMGWQQLFFSGGVSFSTVEESDPIFSLGLGVVF